MLWQLYRKERACGFHLVGRWVGPRAGVYVGVNRNTSYPAGNRTKIIRQMNPFTDWAALNIEINFRVQKNTDNFLSSEGTISFLRRVLSHRVNYIFFFIALKDNRCVLE
jgi:hypothetical protein